MTKSSETKHYLQKYSVGVVVTTTVVRENSASLKAWRHKGGVRVMYWSDEQGSERYINLSDEQARHFADILRQAATQLPDDPPISDG